ncbi:protein-L-isoaspartate O-methyltransferase family protein [Bradyrhizobium liaoningense]|uniref:protein-L-isoaspartate O-methyltransferase family protein n=1 Tax=Bradyrhizobium liaoningense TaxID=43992 RepID=UPI001BAC766B|nr:methyltransferase domain-containing protein [Bradyrhizobium liaoningense]MBR0858437.1 methyltransferase domain-containing protein [Bradyrhizobium liaoningense]
MDDTLAAARRWYAEDLRYKAPVLRNPQLIEAFASVPREQFVGPGPWRIISDPYDNDAFLTPDADPRWLYHDVLVTIDASRNLNNGMPGFWARNLENLDIARGERVLQVGAGTGYYSAVLADLVGPAGRVTAVETDPALAAQARANLASWPQVDVVSGDGRTVDVGELDIVIVFAGSTNPSPLWLDRLVEGGRLLMPLTSESWRGFLLRVIRHGDRFEACSIGGVAVYPCTSGRDEDAGRRLHAALEGLPPGKVPIRALHVGDPRPDEAEKVWFQAQGFWLEREAMGKKHRALTRSTVHHTRASIPKNRPLGRRWWHDALKTAWNRVSCAGSCRRVEAHTASNWLRRDLGLTEDDMTSHSERIDEIRGKHVGWL